jgi:hypothetical protein
LIGGALRVMQTWEWLNDALVVCLALGVWLGLGYPVARKLGPSVVWPASAGPPLGLAIFSVFTVVLYAIGLQLETAFNICIGVGIPGIVLAVRDGLRARLSRSHGAFLVALLIAMLFVLLPKWVGPPEFSVFQANVADQLNYLTGAWMAQHYDYPTIRHMDLESRIAIGLAVYIPTLMRPAAALMLGSLASAVDQPVLITAYAYLSALQLCIFFASLFVLRNVIELSNAYSLFLSFGLSVGFFLQYSFDINAWSALAALSLLTLYAGLFTLGLATQGSNETTQMTRGALSEAGLFWSMLVCMAGVWYNYPESWSLVAAISAPIVAYQFFVSSNRRYFFRRVLLIVLAAGCATALCALAWPMTVGVLAQQAHFLANPSIKAEMADWWKITHRYLFGYDIDWNTAFDLIALWHQSFLGFLYRVLSIVTGFVAGILGVYFLQPDRIWLGFRAAWKLMLLAALAGLLGFWLRGLLRVSGEPRQRMHRALFAGVLGGLALVGGLLLVGQPYAAGKALTWLSPIATLAFIGPLLLDKRNPQIIKVLAVAYVGVQIAFGGYRSYAAATGAYGVHYRSPYTLDIGRKMFYHWDYAGLQAALRGCSRVSIDIEDPYHELFVEMTVADMGIRWSSRRPVWGFDRRGREGIQKQIDNPDCAVTTQARSIQLSQTVVWLRRDDRVLKFYRGETNRLMLVPDFPPELESEGFAVSEPPIDGQVGINRHAVIRIPNNPTAPARRLTLSVDPGSLPADIRVLINGKAALAEVMPRRDDRTDSSRTVELPDIGTDAWLNIELDSETSLVAGDTRMRGARLRFLALER